MARHRTRSQVSSAKQRFYERLEDGAEVIVARLLANGESVVYRARVILYLDGRVDLSPLGSYRAKSPFKPAIDVPVPGYRDWFMISGLPVLMQRAVRWRCAIASLMRSGPAID
jgi:hypothetical protein